MKTHKYLDDFDVGAVFSSCGRTVTESDIRMFIGATGADHPNHTDAEYSRNHPIFRQPCAPRMLVLTVQRIAYAENEANSCPRCQMGEWLHRQDWLRTLKALKDCCGLGAAGGPSRPAGVPDRVSFASAPPLASRDRP